MAFFPSKAASVTISATSRPYNTFKLAFKSEIADTTNFTSAGYQSNEAGIFMCDVTFSGPYDGAEGFLPGDSVAITFATGGAGPSFAPTVRLSEVDIDSANIRNSVSQIACTGTSNGTYSITI